jgi:hypothetical protein
MNRIICAIALFLFLFTSCKKEELLPEPEPSIIATDNPPASLFPYGTPYGQSNQVWVDSAMFSKAKLQGNMCNFDPWTGQSFDCGLWYLVPAKKFWGILGDKIYVSQSMDWYATSPNVYLQTNDVMRRKKSGIGSSCVNCQNPVGTYMITWVQ